MFEGRGVVWNLTYEFLPPRITRKMEKNESVHMIHKNTDTNRKPIYMNFYDSLDTF